VVVVVDRKVKDHLRIHLESRLLPRKPRFAEIQRSQWDDDFANAVCNRLVYDGTTDEQHTVGRIPLRRLYWRHHKFFGYMRNRMIVGAYRYGLITDPALPQYDNIGSIIDRALRYLRDGNLEHMVDIANLAMVENVRECCLPVRVRSEPWMTHPILLVDPGEEVRDLMYLAAVYIGTGHKPHLVDIAALAWIEFAEGRGHQDPHFSPVDDGYHTQKL